MKNHQFLDVIPTLAGATDSASHSGFGTIKNRANRGGTPNLHQIEKPPCGGFQVLEFGGQGRNRTIDTRIFSPRHCVVTIRFIS